MHLILKRLQLDPDVTIGSLSIDDNFTAWTCEDGVRDVKIAGKTAIPFGSYVITITWSPRFQRMLPLLMNVPDFTGVRIHPGNTAADTEGCILPGLDRLPKGVGRSRKAFDYIFVRLDGALRNHEQVTIEITKDAP